jgi:hypothetical protein
LRLPGRNDEIRRRMTLVQRYKRQCVEHPSPRDEQMRIAEADWKKFKRVRALALDRFSQRVLDECARIHGDDSLPAHQRYLELYRLFQIRDRELARMFDDPRRSTAVFSLMQMRRHGLLTEQEISQFSEETQRMARVD